MERLRELVTQYICEENCFKNFDRAPKDCEECTSKKEYIQDKEFFYQTVLKNIKIKNIEINNLTEYDIENLIY